MRQINARFEKPSAVNSSLRLASSSRIVSGNVLFARVTFHTIEPARGNGLRYSVRRYRPDYLFVEDYSVFRNECRCNTSYQS